MGVFENCSVFLELKNVLFKDKKKLKTAITENGGDICFLVNEQVRWGSDCKCRITSSPFLNVRLHFPQCSLIVTSNVSSLSATRLRSIKKYQTPVVGMDYVYSCLERGVLLPVDDYKLDASSPPAVISTGSDVIFSRLCHFKTFCAHLLCLCMQ